MIRTVDESDVTALVALAVSGDAAATSDLITRYRPAVLRYCRARLGRFSGSYDAADDAAQEVFVAVLAALPKYRDVGKPFAAFVFGIASHKIADAARSSYRRPVPMAEVPDTIDPADDPETAALRSADADRARALLALLPLPQQELLHLRIAAGLSAEEAGAALGMSPGAVRVAQHRALARLRELATQDVR
jgi:RNA polymerase sigma-70 factor (ECF subfamily)